MDRINGADTIDIGGGNRGFKDENVVGGITGTEVTAAHMNGIQEELMTVIERFELDPNAGDWTQLWQALQFMMSKALPIDEDTITYLNVYPIILTAGNAAAVSSPSAGNIDLAAFEWSWRQFKQLSVADESFVTVANKTYHLYLIYNPVTDVQTLTLFDLADVAYNPSAKADGDTDFDAGYDALFIARIVTDGGNVATITPLKNVRDYSLLVEKTTYELSALLTERGPDTAPTYTVNLARRPSFLLETYKVGPATSYILDIPANVFYDADRYTARPQIVGVYTDDTQTDTGTIDAVYSGIIRA